jgi:hypothetical protein
MHHTIRNGRYTFPVSVSPSMTNFGDEREATVLVPSRHFARALGIPVGWERETIDLHRVDRGG